MNYRGHNIDPLKLWENYVDFPPHMETDTEFSPLVQCPNPNHDTNKRHFQINLRQPTTHCFASCGISGSYEHAIAIIEGLYANYTDDARGKKQARYRASKLILRAANIRSGNLPNRKYRPTGISKSGRVNASDAAAREIDPTVFRHIPERGLEYLAKRGIEAQSIAQFEVGWDAEERRIVLPVRDVRGKLKFLIKRAVREKDFPKYLYTDEAVKSSVLYGACVIDPGMLQSLGMVLVEGSIDCIRLHQHGIATAVATLGTGISKRQAEILHRFRPPKVILMFDKDIAGIHGIEIAEKRLKKIPLYVCRYPNGKSDPAELTREEAHRVLSRAVPLRKFKRQLPRTERRITSGTSQA